MQSVVQYQIVVLVGLGADSVYYTLPRVARVYFHVQRRSHPSSFSRLRADVRCDWFVADAHFCPIIILRWLLICPSVQCYWCIVELLDARYVSCVGPKGQGGLT